MTNFLSRAEVENGYLRIDLSNYLEFVEFCNFFTGIGGYYFRGQKDSDWTLTTTLDRFSKKLDNRMTGTYDYLLNSFSRLLRGIASIEKDVANNEDELWALGQHYGLPTPLLDWTESAFISLFFAFEDQIPSNSGRRTVWAIHRYIEEAMQKFNQEKNKYTEFKFVDPITDHNNRLISQRGIFTKQPLNFQFEQWVMHEFQGVTTKGMLFKITLPEQERRIILGQLNLMNINFSSLFPDVSGAARQAAFSLQDILNTSILQMDNQQLFEHANYNHLNRNNA